MVMFKAKFRPQASDKPQAQQQQQPQPTPPMPKPQQQEDKAPPIEKEQGPQVPIELPGKPGAPERVA